MDSITPNNRYEVLTKNGFKPFWGIKKTTGKHLRIYFTDGGNLGCSLNHKVLSNGSFVEASTLTIGCDVDGKTVERIDHLGETDLFDLLEVEDGNHYLTNGVTSHNCAFIPTTKYHEFMTSTYPTISSGKETRMIMVSTPNGMNHYYDIWQKAVKKESKYVPFQINWWDVPGRDEAWKAEVIANTSEEQFAQEFGNQFIGSSSTLLSNDVLERLDIHDPIYSNKNIRIYEEPTLGHDYMIVADCADGGEDNSACTVFDITQKPFKQVATFYGRISHLLYPAILAQLGIKYNECPILVERNDIGKTILHILNYDLEYPNIINTRQGGKVRMGITTTAGNRLVACSRLKDMIEKGLLKIVDKNSIFELYNFVWTGKRYEADTGYHDDSVMGLALFSYYVNTPQFTMRYDMEMRAEFLKKAEEEMYENLTPLPLFNDWCDAHPQGLSDEDRDWLLS